MSEYIVEYPSWADECIDIEGCLNIHERIVRCSDCKHSDGSYCNRLGYAVFLANPDGFCAWGEPKEGD